MTATDGPDDEPTTQGGYVLPPPVHPGEFVGPADDLDRYELIGSGISGGEGTTWRARYHGRLQAPLPLAVKQLRPPIGAEPDWPSDADRRRWQDKAALLRHLQPEHVVRLHEIFFGPAPHEAGKGDADRPHAAYLVMEWVQGPTLRELCRDRPARRDTIRKLLAYVAQAATALTELSSQTRSAGNPSLHRDVKPGNCIINDDRGLVLIDVSTLRLVDDGFDPVGLHTPQYTAPEVLAAPHLPRTPATDVYSLGALAAYCLTGRDPAPGGDNRADLEAAARSAGVADPAALATHIMTTLDADPDRRPTDLARWSRRLLALGRPSRRRAVYAIAAVLAVLLVVGWLLVDPAGLRRHERSGAPVSPPSGFAGAITSPADGSDVKQCSYFEGTATVPAGMTLILAMQNLSNASPERYAEFVFGWEDPTRLSAWRGAQYFGQGNDSVGQDYRVQLITVRLDAARRWKGSGDPGSSLAAGGTLLAEVRLHRVTGLVANFCEGP
jgi:serine/threonine protein kinase